MGFEAFTEQASFSAAIPVCDGPSYLYLFSALRLKTAKI